MFWLLTENFYALGVQHQMVLKFDRDSREAVKTDSNMQQHSETYSLTKRAELRSPLFYISSGTTYCFSLSWAMQSQEDALFGVVLETWVSLLEKLSLGNNYSEFMELMQEVHNFRNNIYIFWEYSSSMFIWLIWSALLKKKRSHVDKYKQIVKCSEAITLGIILELWLFSDN